MSDLPLISCIMPTFNRQRFIPQALKMFSAQTYPNKELVIVDDSTDHETRDYMSGLSAWPWNLRYHQVYTRVSVGTKRNLACEHARGSVIAHFDDDDWQNPHRLANQLRQLKGFDLTGLDSQLYYRPEDSTAWRYTFWRDSRWYTIGNTFMYTRDLWSRHKFKDISGCEDTQWLMDGIGKIRVNAQIDCHVIGLIHDNNSGPKSLTSPFWKAATLRELAESMSPDDLRFFSSVR